MKYTEWKRIIAYAVCLITIVAVVHFPGFADERTMTVHTAVQLVYTDDYPALYEEKLKQIFGDYTLGERTERHIDGEYCSCGYHRATEDYYEWQISYTDSCGQVMNCTLTNKDSLYAQQYDWLEAQIKAHLFASYLDEEFFKTTCSTLRYLIIRIGDIINSGRNDDFSCMHSAQKYKENLLQSSELLKLNEMSYQEIFDRFPITITAAFQIEDENNGTEKLNAALTNACALIEQKVGYMLSEIGDNLNIHLRIIVKTSDPAVTQKRLSFYYIRGEHEELNVHETSFGDVVYDSYKGKFW